MKTKIMKLLRVSVMGLLFLCLAIVPVYSKSEHGQGQGQDQNQGNQGQGNQDRGKSGQDHGNQGQGNSSNSSSVNRASAPEVRRQTIERDKNQANLRANLPEKTNQAIGRNHEKGTGVKRAFEKARWSYNPKDQRGQGNMGKVDMRDPYGFDKDSGREKGERGRAIHEKELVLDLASLLSLSVQIADPWYLTLLQQVDYWLQQANNLNSYYSKNTIQWYLSYWQNRVANYVPPAYDKVWVGNTTLPKIINFSLDASGLPETFEGTNLLVNMTLTSINDYTESFSFVDWSRRADANEPNYYGWPIVTVTYQYDAGQVAAEYNQEITLNGDGTYNFSYTPPEELSVGPKGGYFELAVTVTEPISGASYTMTYDRQILLLRCPYGRVYDDKTDQAIVGAKVTVHYEDGSIVSLDKAANPTAHNPQTTDATGRYGFKLETNKKYYITATAPGYQDFKSGVFTEKWHVLREDIALSPLQTMK